MTGATSRVPMQGSAEPAEGLLSPVRREDRIGALDVLRGCAVMGILLMNIVSFGLPEWTYFVPLGTTLPVFSGPHAHLNTAAWMLRNIFADGKMRAVFSTLFGAGVILLTERAERRDAGAQVADIYLRRNIWLMFFGVAHSFLIWNGDILFDYGLVALLFLYPLRKLRAATLFRLTGGILLVWMLGSSLGHTLHVRSVQRRGRAAIAEAHSGRELTEQQREAISAKVQMDQRWWPSTKAAREDVASMHGRLLSVETRNMQNAFYTESRSTYVSFPDVLIFMLLGMALYKTGFLTGRLSYAVYGWTAAIGFSISISLGLAGVLHAWRSGFEIVQTTAWLSLPYEPCRLCGALASISAVLLVVKSGLAQPLMSRIGAVGQTALTNYLLTSVVCRFLFVWGPTHWFGRLEYFQLYFVVAGVWLLNLMWSSVWLRYFQFGPVEWLWRSLTYCRPQPFRLARSAPFLETKTVPVS